MKQVNAIPDDTDNQISLLDSAFYRLHKKSIEDKIIFYDFKGAFYARKKDYLKGLLYADSILFLTEDKLKIPHLAGWYRSSLYSKGDMFLAQKKYDEAFFYYSTAQSISTGIPEDSCRSSGYLARLGNILFKQGKYRLAAGYFLNAYKKDTICHRNEFLKFAYRQTNLDNTGICYSKLNNWDSAQYYYNATLDFIAKNENRFPQKADFIETAKAVVYGNQAIFYAVHKDFNNAEALYQKSIDIIKVHDISFAQALQLELANQYTLNKLFPESEGRLNEMYRSFKIHPDEHNLLKYYKIKSDNLLKQGMKDQASEYLQKYILLKDSIEIRDEYFASMDAGTELENMHQRQVNESLQKDNQLKSVYLLVFIVATILAIAAIFLFSYNTKKTSKLNRELAVRHERERISKDLHDDLGSGLTSIQILIKRLLHQPGEINRGSLSAIEEIAENMNAQMNEIIWVLNHADDTVHGLFAHLRAYMADYIDKTGLELSLDVKTDAGEDHSISNVQRRNLLLVIKEVFHNVIKHANASRFSLHTSIDKKTLRVIIKDNGIGFDVQNGSNGYGIQNMKKRIENIQGTISFENLNGLQIKIDIPLAS